jgi:hypothetical protein
VRTGPTLETWQGWAITLALVIAVIIIALVR